METAGLMPDHSHSAAFQEFMASMRELREYQQETDRQMRKTEQKMKETDRKISKLGDRFGEMVEHLVAPNLKEKFNELGFHFDRTSRDFELKEPGDTGALAEVDIMLENSDMVIAVEVKAKPKHSDIDDHIKRMEILRRSADRRGDQRTYRGAIAGAIMSESVSNYALKTGFYLIEQTGDTVRILQPSGFTPRDW